MVYNNKKGALLILSILFFFFVLMLLSNSGKEIKDINVELEQIPDIEENLIINKNISVDFAAIRGIAEGLNKGTNYYDEEESSKKALELLEKQEDSFQTFYYKGYANEIIGNYDEAISFYDDKISEIADIDVKDKALVLNQLGHVYDLKGDTQKANEYYVKAEELGQDLIGIYVNRGRVEFRNGNYDEAERYFNLVLKGSTDSFIRAEMYFNLSTIYQTKEDGLDKAIMYAKLGIPTEKNYPNNYLSLGISYIMKGGDYLDKSVENLQKATTLNPRGSLAYKYLGIYYYIKDDFDKAILNFEQQQTKASKDIMLMANDRETIEKEAIYDLSKVYALKGNATKSMEFLNKVLDGSAGVFYPSFLRDFAFEDGPFKLIMETDIFKQNMSNIITRYK